MNQFFSRRLRGRVITVIYERYQGLARGSDSWVLRISWKILDGSHHSMNKLYYNPVATTRRLQLLRKLRALLAQNIAGSDPCRGAARLLENIGAVGRPFCAEEPQLIESL